MRNQNVLRPRGAFARTLAVLMLAVMTGACGSREYVWAPYHPTGSAVTAELPGTPLIEHRTFDIGYGTASAELARVEFGGTETFGVLTISLPGGRSPRTEDELLDLAVDSFLNREQIPRGPARPIQLGPYRGAEYDANVQTDKRGWVRAYLVKGAVYMFYAQGDMESTFPQRRDKFFGSVALDPEAAQPDVPSARNASPRKGRKS